MKVEPCNDYGYLASISGCEVADLKKPAIRYYVATHDNRRCGAFMVIGQAEPDLHVLLNVKGKLALEAVRLICERIYQDYRTDRVKAWIPHTDKRTRYMAIAAGFERTGRNKDNAIYARRR